jgi:signal transduction histidine kinase/CheY-like chemotaxis protein
MKTFLRRLVQAGTDKVSDAMVKEKMVILNKCLYITVLLFIPNMVYEIWLNLPYTVVIDACFTLVIVLCIIGNASGNYFFARNLVIVSANLLLLSGTYAEGIAAGNYIIYLPLVVIFSLLIKAGEDRRLIISLIFLTTTCMGLCLLCPQKSQIQEISEAVYKAMFIENLGLAFILTVVFTWMGSVISLERQRQMQQARDIAEESTRAKSMFLSNMSHELRTPLNGIIGTANLLLDEVYLPAQKEHLDVLKYSSRHMLTLINDILDVNKIDAGKLELQQKPVNLYQLLGQIESVFAHQFEVKNLRLLLERDTKINFLVFADETRLTQVLNNLLANALKFTHRGQVALSADLIEGKSDCIEVQFSVSDTGIGIPEQKLGQIFESFTQADNSTNRQYGGTGLGLSISKKIVTAMGGDLRVNSRVGRGSTFFFMLPFRRGNLQGSHIPSDQKAPLQRLPGMRILIAEDNVINMRVARKFLEAWEIDVTEAVNGLDAVEKAREQAFDLFLFDLEMPIMDGYDALVKIREFNTHTPAIAFSAAMFANIRQQLEEKGFSDFISKPFRPDDLHQKILQSREKA